MIRYPTHTRARIPPVRLSDRRFPASDRRFIGQQQVSDRSFVIGLSDTFNCPIKPPFYAVCSLSDNGHRGIHAHAHARARGIRRQQRNIGRGDYRPRQPQDRRNPAGCRPRVVGAGIETLAAKRARIECNHLAELESAKRARRVADIQEPGDKAARAKLSPANYGLQPEDDHA